MQAVIWFLGLFAAAVALALFAGDNAASVTVFWPPYRVDVSLNLALLLLLALLGLLYAVLRTVQGLLTLPLQAHRWRMRQHQRATAELMLEARLHLLAGRFGRARRSAEAVLARLPVVLEAGADASGTEYGALRLLAQLTAVEAAQAMGQEALGEQHLQAAETDLEQAQAAPELHEALHLHVARRRLEAQQPDAALHRLARLTPAARRRLAARRLYLQAWRQQAHWSPALGSWLALQRRGLLTDADVLPWVRNCTRVGPLHRLWTLLDPVNRARPALALSVAARMLELHAAPSQVRCVLWPLWQRYVQHADALTEADEMRLLDLLESSLAQAQETGEDAGTTNQDHGPLVWVQHIEAAGQSWPGHTRLQALAERVGLQRQLW